MIHAPRAVAVFVLLVCFVVLYNILRAKREALRPSEAVGFVAFIGLVCLVVGLNLSAKGELGWAFWAQSLGLAVGMLAVLGAVAWAGIFGRQRREGGLYLRRIPGLEAIDEAVGRATEMGRPMLFSLGLEGLTVTTFAGLAVLGYVARLSARYGARLLVPVCQPEVLPVAREVVREAYQAEGRLDAYNPEDIRYLTSDQFGYASGVVGMMHREKVASNFFFGGFAAESLILAETGHHVGAMQVAGTPDMYQIPFFIAACDYTVIGEEFYAASAYLSREPVMLGSVVGQDWGKGALFLLILLGILAKCAIVLQVPWLSEFGRAFLKFLVPGVG
ncbi:MAG TPA: hypothetical protein EYP65_04355 [Armatimonadetes bacterium]|nr:hypothetical protein [Armatimonadota bacterium]